ncbi:Satratoxin biosynthesis SC1 cluster protein 4 [Colletotrichum orbiculare MAFF 240422]|uniref:Satratoxin biosynthesis SC1 cluster protein 4 n=1 Tax=Colletotrichum orbiculare (strain 104-T / ATCC 96160 / CBS 514.97 / LARS 414 / MAFF 240422) TaxID=1213857 RepID=N4VH73_COLOR|nr:Satratoxin biosynthesis SC1 cluster protein 4 [Colletotrichum orbiculare MAFF 240422]
MDESLYVMPPPRGQVRTTVNPPSTAGGVLPVGIATTAIAFVAVALRVFTRTYVMGGRLGNDDYLALFAMATALSYCGLVFRLVPLGAGKHMWDVLAMDYSPAFLLTTLGVTIAHTTSVTFSKLSILAFYLRLSLEKHFRWTVFGLIAIVTVYTVAYQFVIIFQCQPIQAGWDTSVKGKCIGKLVPMMTLSAAHIVTDIIVLLMPVKAVWALQMARRQKVSIILLFATGIFVCASAIERTILLLPLLESSDYTWDVPPEMIWGFVEINAGLICAAVPALKPFFMRYLPFILSSKLRSPQTRSRYASWSIPSNGSGRKQKTRVQTFDLPHINEFPLDLPRSGTERRERNNSTVDSIDAQYPGRLGPAIVVTTWKRGSEDAQTPSKGIGVTRETTISYDSG